METFWFVGAEGTKVEGFLIKPPGFDAAKKYPVKFVMHGGPQTALGDSWSYRWNWELMAAADMWWWVSIGAGRLAMGRSLSMRSAATGAGGPTRT